MIGVCFAAGRANFARRARLVHPLSVTLSVGSGSQPDLVVVKTPRRGVIGSSPRLEPRESTLPWTRGHCRARRIGRLGAAGAVACSKTVANGFSQLTPSVVTARPPAVKRHAVGGAGMRSRRIGPVTTAESTANSKHGVIGGAARSGHRPLLLWPLGRARQLHVPGATA